MMTVQWIYNRQETVTHESQNRSRRDCEAVAESERGRCIEREILTCLKQDTGAAADCDVMR